MQGSSEASTSQTPLNSDGHAQARPSGKDSAKTSKAFESWRRNLSQLTGLGLTEEDRQLRDQEKQSQKLMQDCRRCQGWRDKVVMESPIVRFLLQHIDSLPKPDYMESATAPPEYNVPANSPVPITCIPCGPNASGGFLPNGGVLLCQDRLMGRKHTEDALAHELIHEWDHRRFNVDWSNVRMVACSEIRASSLSGDCRWGREVQRRHYNFTKQHQECTKRRAAISVMSHLAAYEATPQSNEARRLEANRIVNEVWDSCWKDTRPFDEIY